MADLGKAYVQIIPKAEGISGKIEEVISPEASAAGKSAGKTVMTKMGAAFGTAGSVMTKGLSVPLAGIGVASVAAFNEVHGGLETIIQKTGASGDALDGMKDIMNNIAGSVPSDFATIGAAVGEVNTRFGSTGEELETLATKFVQFADLNGTDVSSSIDSVQSAMAAFGLSSKDTGAFLDTLNKAGQDTGVSVDQLANDLTTNAASLKEMGYSASDAANFVANLSKNGIDSSTVMAGMKKAFAEATENGQTMSEAMSGLQESMQNAGSDTEAYQEALELFGNRAGPALASAIQDGRLSFEALGTSINDNLGNVEETFNNTLTPADEAKTAFNKLKTAGSELGTTLGTILTPVIEKISDVIQKLSDKWNELDPEVQDAITKAAMVVAAVGPVLMIVSKLIGIITTVTTVISMLSMPTLGIVAAIAAVIAIIILCITHWDQIKAKMIEVGNAIKEKVTAAWNSLKSAVSNAVNSIKTKAVNAWNSIKDKTKAAWDKIKTSVTDAADKIKTKLKSAWDSVKNSAKSAWDKVKSHIVDPIEKAKDKVKGVVDKIKGFFPLNLGNIFNLKLPHFSISGGTPPFGLMGKGSMPSWSVSWYAKAMDTPYMFTQPTLFGAGEAGNEIMYGRDNLMRDIREAAGGGVTNTFYITVDGAENPEEWTDRFIREFKLQTRTA